MADLALNARSAFTGWTPIKTLLLSADIREGLSLASIAAGRGHSSAVTTAIADRYAVTLPSTPVVAVGKDVNILWAGPDQWIAVADAAFGRDLERDLKDTLNGIAAVTDISDARAVMRISGAKARAVLAKGLPLDLHPTVFKPGSIAISHASHIGVIIWQVDDTPTYDVAMFRSYADSFAHWLKDAAAEFTS